MSTLRFRTFGMFLLDLGTAFIGTAIVEFPIGKLVRAQSIPGVIWKEWILTIFFAALLGFLMFRTWRSNTAKFLFVATSVWFGFGCLLYAISRPDPSVLPSHRSFWFRFSGSACGTDPLQCAQFFAFTIPLIRGIAYSSGAFISSRFCRPVLDQGTDEETRLA
jgi:hypothetical protein